MEIDDELVALIKDDPITGVLEFCNRARNYFDREYINDPDYYEVLLEIYAFLESLSNAQIIGFDFEIPKRSGSEAEEYNVVYQAISDLRDECNSKNNNLKYQKYKSRFNLGFSRQFFYEFSQGDIDRIQELINQLRENLVKSNLFEDDHKRRLLARLEKLQAEIHKKMSDIDKFWGLVGDAGVVLGKLGKDAKPFVDRIKEIADIVWRTQSRAEELPSGTKIPLLETSDNE